MFPATGLRSIFELANRRLVNNHLCVLRKMLNLAVEWGLLHHAPRVKQLRVFHSEIAFPWFDESDRFLRAAAPEWKALLVTALKTGLRVGELPALNWEALDLVARLVVDAYPPEQRERVASAFQAALAGRMTGVETNIAGRAVELRAGPVLDSEGRVVMGVATVQVVTKRRGAAT